jgi:UDP-glucose 4-epimerase
VVVTGGCGFIGSHLAERLVKEDNTVIVVDNLSTGSLQNIKGLKVNFLNEPYNKISSLASEIDTIFHLGMPSSSPMYRLNPNLVGEAIIDAIAIFEYAKGNGCRVVYASSSSVYNGNEIPYREDMPILVKDYYTECRYAIERLAELYNTLYGVKTAGLRLFSVYGPREESKGRYANIVSQFLWALRKNDIPVIYGDGTQTRDFIYVDDVVEAFILTKNKDFEHGIFNVGTGVSRSFNDVIDVLNEELGKNVNPEYVPNPIKNYVLNTLADPSKTENTLEFKAKISLQEGISKLNISS